MYNTNFGVYIKIQSLDQLIISLHCFSWDIIFYGSFVIICKVNIETRRSEKEEIKNIIAQNLTKFGKKYPCSHNYNTALIKQISLLILP